MTQGLDYAGGRIPGAAVAAAGYQFSCRYLYDGSPQLPSKLLTATEAANLIAAGVNIVSNWEQAANNALAGSTQGITDAQAAQANHAAAGGPPTAPIYFSVDWDASESDQVAINAYFTGVASVIGLSRTGAYGGYWVIKRLFDAGLITWGWQTEAWSSDPAGLGPDDPFGDGCYLDPRAQILQRNALGYVTVGGVQCDVNVALAPNYGQWNVPVTPPPGPGPGPSPTPESQAQMIQEIWDQLRGPNGQGWPELGMRADGKGFRTPVDALAHLMGDPNA